MSYKEDLELVVDSGYTLGLRAVLSHIGGLADKEIKELKKDSVELRYRFIKLRGRNLKLFRAIKYSTDYLDDNELNT